MMTTTVTSSASRAAAANCWPLGAASRGRLGRSAVWVDFRVDFGQTVRGTTCGIDATVQSA
eukprot:10114-Rhodomonas_salina.1